MGRTIVRILNLGYLAAAAVSIWSVCTKPIFRTKVSIDMTPEKLGEVLEPLFEGASKSTVRAPITKDSEKSITDYITVERIADAFRDDDPKKNGFHLSVPITVDAKYAFDLQNKKVIDAVITQNVKAIIKSSCETLADPLAKFVFSITEEFALDALETAINAQINNAIQDGAPITSQEVKDIYNNVYEALKDNDGSIPLSDLTDVIIHGKDGEGTSALSILNKYTRYVYVVCSPQPTEEEFNANPTEYFIHPDTGRYENTETYDPSATYYTYNYIACDPAPTAEEFAAEPTKYFVYDSEQGKYVNTESFDSSASYFVREDKPYTEEDLDRIDIEGQMESALKEVPGLVENVFKEAGDVEEAVFTATLKSDKYYISDGTTYVPAAVNEGLETLYVKEGDTFVLAPAGVTDFTSTLVSNKYYVLDGEEYVAARYPYSAETTYYISEASINDIDTALVALINGYLLKKGEEDPGSKAALRTRAQGLTNAKSKEELTAALTEFAMKYIPLEKVVSVEDSYGKYVPLALLGIVSLVAFPWALLALVTFIRTLRKKKCWTKPWVVIVLAFPQIFFGLFLTYGAKYGLEVAAGRVEIIKKLLDSGLSLELSTLCLIPSFVYLAVFVYSIFYAFFAHGVKVQYKLEKRQDAIDRYRARRGY